MTQTTIHTAGGPAFEDFHGNYVQGNQIILLNAANPQELDAALQALMRLLALPESAQHKDGSQIRLSAPGATITLSEDNARKLLQRAAAQHDLNAYLAALVIHPDYAQWGARYVPLEGWRSLPATATENWQRALQPEFCQLKLQGGEAQRRIERVLIPDVRTALQDTPAIVLLGDPGSGKTTTLRRLMLQTAQHHLQNQAGSIPVFLPLNEYRPPDAAYTPEKWLYERWQRDIGSTDALRHTKHNGGLFLLCDALNEMPYPNYEAYRARVGWWRDFARAYATQGNTIVFTCRSRDYSEPLNLPQVEILALTPERVQQFLQMRLPEPLAHTTWTRLEKNADLLQLMGNPYYLSMLAFLLEEQNAWVESRPALFAAFVRTLLAREESKHADFPGSTALQNALTVLAAQMQPSGQSTQWARSRVLNALPTTVAAHAGQPLNLPPETSLRLSLSATLLDVRSPADGSSEEQIQFYHQQLQEYFAARHLLQVWHSHPQRTAEFWHHPLTARAMPPHTPANQDEPLPPPPTTGWEEPTLMAAVLADDPAAFVQAVCRSNPPLAARCLLQAGLPALPAVKQQVQTALLHQMQTPANHRRARLAAGDALGQLGDPRFVEQPGKYGALIAPDWVALPGGTAVLGSGTVQVLQARLGGWFNAMRDELPRHRVHVPPFYLARYPVTNAEFDCFTRAGGYDDPQWWQSAAAARWRSGEDRSDWQNHELMQAWRALQGKSAAQITRELKALGFVQRSIEFYLAFVEFSEAQALDWVQRTYGGEAGAARQQPAYRNDPRFGAPTQPVVGVCWYEAQAYCTWLNAQLQAQPNLLPEGNWRVGLPSEAEWEYAARYSPLPSPLTPNPLSSPKGTPKGRGVCSGRVYAWGNQFDTEHANTYEGRLLRPSPVGMFPQGATPGTQLHDMTGNVWEWTRSLYQPYPYRADDGRENPEDSNMRVVRGGSWNFNIRSVRCASRFRYFPAIFYDFLGFRMVLSLAVSGS